MSTKTPAIEVETAWIRQFEILARVWLGAVFDQENGREYPDPDDPDSYSDMDEVVKYHEAQFLSHLKAVPFIL